MKFRFTNSMVNELLESINHKKYDSTNPYHVRSRDLIVEKYKVITDNNISSDTMNRSCKKSLMEIING